MPSIAPGLPPWRMASDMLDERPMARLGPGLDPARAGWSTRSNSVTENFRTRRWTWSMDTRTRELATVSACRWVALKSHTQRLKGQRALLFTPLLSSLPSFSALADSGQQRPTTRYKSHFHVSRSRFATILGQNRPPTSTHGLPAPAIA